MATGITLARGDGLTRLAGARAGALLSGRGEFSILVAGIAASSLNAPPQLAALAATFVLLTAIVGPVLARLLVRATRGEVAASVAGAPA